MTVPAMPTVRQQLEAAEAMVAFYRTLVDADACLTPEKKRGAHERLDAMLLNFALRLAPQAGPPQ